MYRACETHPCGCFSHKSIVYALLWCRGRVALNTPVWLLQVAPKTACTICILSGGAQRPSGLPDKAHCLLEEWLLNAAEQYQLPAFTEWLP